MFWGLVVRPEMVSQGSLVQKFSSCGSTIPPFQKLGPPFSSYPWVLTVAMASALGKALLSDSRDHVPGNSGGNWPVDMLPRGGWKAMFGLRLRVRLGVRWALADQPRSWVHIHSIVPMRKLSSKFSLSALFICCRLLVWYEHW